MVNFGQLVESVLLKEAIVGVPEWFNKLLVKHKELFDVAITDEDLTDFFNLLDDVKISETEGLKDLNKIRILDVMKSFYDSMAPKPTNLNEFKQDITTNTSVYEKKITSLLNLNKQNRLNWKVSNPKILDLKTRTEKLAGQKGADTLASEYGNDFIIPAVQRIVKKRVDFFTRITKLKSPTTPFTNLITDVFKYPQQYKSGAKKYTSDFEEIDKFYIDNLIDIALAAQDFYTAEMAQLKLAQEVNASLNLFDLMVGDVLNEILDQFGNPIQSNQSNNNQPTQPQTAPKEVVDKIKQELLSEPQIQNKLNFYLGKSVAYNLTDLDGTDKETTKQTDPENYKINQLQKNPRAKNLIQSLSRVAEYTKKKPGAGERMKQLGSAADATMAAMGVKLYGG